MGGNINVIGVGKVFSGADGGEVEAISDVDFCIPEGGFVSIIGPSGCGKSTLLRIIAGLIRPSRGEVKFGGRVVSGPDRNVGIVFQSPVLLPWRTVQKNIDIMFEFRKLPSEKFRKKTSQLIEMLGLKGFENSLPHQLSGGMQQRVAIGRALAHDPSVLLMDEPFGALDAYTREQLNLEVQRIWLETKKTVIFITHSITEAIFLSSDIVVMTPRPGRSVAVIKVDAARPRQLGDLGNPNFQSIERDLRALIDEHWKRI